MHTTTASLMLALLTASSAVSQTWDETTDGGGDAGDLPATAQAVVGVGPLATITGNITSGTDVDMYLITVTSMATFSADTSIAPGTLGDTELHLFDITGMGIAFNDDSTGVKSLLPSGDPLYVALPAGNYLVAITNYDNDPESGGGKIFPDTTTTVDGPTGPGGGAPVTVWTNAVSATGTYTITFTSTSFVATSPPTINLAAVTGFTGNAAGGFDMTVAPGAALVNANLDLFDADGDPIDINSITVVPLAIPGVTAPAAPQTGLASGTTISWTGTVSAATTPNAYVYTVNIDDGINPAVNVVVRINVVVGGGGGGGGGGGTPGVGTRGSGRTPSGFLPCGAGAAAAPGSVWPALMALAAAFRRRVR